jgi:Domain of unknown function (DUF4403)
LEIISQPEQGRINIAVPVDVSFTEINKLLEVQLAGKTFPEDGSGPADITVQHAEIAASSDRLLTFGYSIMGDFAAFFEIGSAPLAVHAQVALDEGITRKTAGVEFMSDLPAGKKIRLGEQDIQWLSYLKSCWHEIITDGVVTIGNERSDVISRLLRTQSGA